jgi:hypothetical protein
LPGPKTRRVHRKGKRGIVERPVDPAAYRGVAGGYIRVPDGMRLRGDIRRRFANARERKTMSA